MQLVDKLLANGKMDRYEKIDRIEAILAAAAATAAASGSTPSTGNHSGRSSRAAVTFNCDATTQTEHLETDPRILWAKPSVIPNGVGVGGADKIDSAVQTLSTGEIVITKVHFPLQNDKRDSFAHFETEN
jgi:hypothetical protein